MSGHDVTPEGDDQGACDHGSLGLAHAWVMWYDIGGKKGVHGEDWETNMVTVGEFSTVVGLWNYWNAIDISRLPDGGNVRWMKHPIQPKWEDPANKDGGRLLVRHQSAEWGEQALMDTLLWIVGMGCGTERYEQICGFVFSRRRTGQRVEVWTKALEKAAIESLAVDVQALTGGQEVEYRNHKGGLLYALKKPPKKAQTKQAWPIAIPAPLPRPLGAVPRHHSHGGNMEVDVDALVQQAMPGSTDETAMKKMRNSLQDEAEAAREAMASLPAELTGGIGVDDFTPCSSPVPSPCTSPSVKPGSDKLPNLCTLSECEESSTDTTTDTSKSGVPMAATEAQLLLESSLFQTLAEVSEAAQRSNCQGGDRDKERSSLVDTTPATLHAQGAAPNDGRKTHREDIGSNSMIRGAWAPKAGLAVLALCVSVGVVLIAHEAGSQHEG